METETLSRALGDLARIVTLMLENRAPEIGRGKRMNLRLPVGFLHDECEQHIEAGIEAASSAVVGELLRVYFDGLDVQTASSTLGVFLIHEFDPPIVGFGKVRVVLDEGEKSVVFLTKYSGAGGLDAHAPIASLAASPPAFSLVSESPSDEAASPASATTLDPQAAGTSFVESSISPASQEGQRGATPPRPLLPSLCVSPAMIAAGVRALGESGLLYRESSAAPLVVRRILGSSLGVLRREMRNSAMPLKPRKTHT